MVDRRIITHVSYVMPQYRRYGSFWGKWDGIIHTTVSQTAVTKWTCCLTLRFSLLELLFTSLKFPVLPAETRRQWVRTHVFARQDVTHQILSLLPVLGTTIRNRSEQMLSLRPVPFSSLGVSFPSLYSGAWLLYVSKKKAFFPRDQTNSASLCLKLSCHGWNPNKWFSPAELTASFKELHHLL